MVRSRRPIQLTGETEWTGEARGGVFITFNLIPFSAFIVIVIVVLHLVITTDEKETTSRMDLFCFFTCAAAFEICLFQKRTPHVKPHESPIAQLTD